MKRNQILITALLGWLLIAPCEAQPNLLLIVSDDQRWDTLGCTGNSIIQTPNLDKLAARGALFRNNFCATSICPVSRASIFLGQYERGHHIEDFDTPASPAAWANSYPAILRQHGYAVGFIGKFGLGGALPAKEFDYWAGFPAQGFYFEKDHPEHSTARMGRQAIEFLSTYDHTKPFCLSISFKAPHAQDEGPRYFPPDPKDETLYRDVTISPPPTADDAHFLALPKFIQTSECRTRWRTRFSTPEKYQQSVKDYYRLITGMDRVIGKITAKLEELKLDRNTVIIFTSDNGLFLGDKGLADKWLMYEPSIRTPLIICDPRLPAKRRGVRPDQMTLNVDLAPTIIDEAGLTPPAVMQGHSLKPLLEGRKVAWRKDWFYEHYFTAQGTIPQSEGVRTEDWKYIRYVEYNPPYEELYNLARDPLEEHNLLNDPTSQKKLKELRARWATLKSSLQ
jgi:arylsulfatase A-like enzyme